MNSEYRIGIAVVILLLGGITVALGLWGGIGVRVQASVPNPVPVTDSNTLFFLRQGMEMHLERLQIVPEMERQNKETPVSLVLPSHSAQCEYLGQTLSPDGQWMAVDVSCEDSSHTLLVEVATGKVIPALSEPGEESIFLGWAPEGATSIVRVDPLGENRIVLVRPGEAAMETLDLSPFTYDVVISPDGKQILYALSRGLGFGSEVWVMQRDGSQRRQILTDATGIISYPRWSPDGAALAYIRMVDSNIPFTVGDLYLTDGEGDQPRRLAPADAGHGYPPVWSPDGRYIAFVGRENPGVTAADHSPFFLESNIYLVEVAGGSVQAVTHFPHALTDGPAWSSDGSRLAFRTQVDGAPEIWLWNIAGDTLQPLLQGEDCFSPVWGSD